MAVGDFNLDGVQDLAVANVNSNNLSVLLGNGDGTLQAARNFSVGTSPRSVAALDFNGDGKLDLVVANYGSSNLSVLVGNGDGTFVLGGLQQGFPFQRRVNRIYVEFGRDLYGYIAASR